MVLSNLLAGNYLLAVYNSRQLREAPVVLSQYGGSRECGVLSVGKSLISWSFLCYSRLCFRVSLRLQCEGGIGMFRGMVEFATCRV